MKEFDAIVIGAGQAGPPLAEKLTQEGQHTAIIERQLFGGTCVNVGCIPTKTLVGSARVAALARRAAEFGVSTGGIAVDMKRVKARMDQVRGDSNRGVTAWLEGMNNKIRVSQINGCAFCVGMHIKEAKEDGVGENQLHLLPVWRETSAFSAREKVALAWAESVTLMAGSGVSDSAYEAVNAEFSAREIAELTVSIGNMNLWNRIGVSAHMPT